jgi:predicted Zn-dependent peptidase
MAAYQEFRLKNGLQISAYQLPHLHSLEMGVYLRGGSLYENRSNQGVSHLLEHLCFRNMNGLPQGQLYRQLDAMGAKLTGTTYPESVIFQMRVVPRFFDDAFELLLRLFAQGKWTQEEINAEKQVVLRQIENDEQNFLWDMSTRYFKTKAGAFPGMGTKDSVMRMSEDVINLWKRKIFRPSNACFALTGNFSDGMLEKAKEILGELPDIGPCVFEQPSPMNFSARDEHSDEMYNADYDLAQVLIYFDIDTNLVFPACAEMLSHMTGDGLSSVLFLELREKHTLVDDISSEVVTVGPYRRFAIDYEVMHDRLTESLELVFSILGRLRRFISHEQMDRSRIYFTENERILLDKAGTMNDRLGMAWLSGNTDECDIDIRMRMHADLTAEDIQDAAQAIFRPETMCCFIEKNPKKVKAAVLRETLQKCRELLK